MRLGAIWENLTAVAKILPYEPTGKLLNVPENYKTYAQYVEAYRVKSVDTSKPIMSESEWNARKQSVLEFETNESIKQAQRQMDYANYVSNYWKTAMINGSKGGMPMSFQQWSVMRGSLEDTAAALVTSAVTSAAPIVPQLLKSTEDITKHPLSKILKTIA